MDRILYFDCFSGISGDMTLGALIDLGLDPEVVRKEIEKIGISGYNFSVQRTQKYGISGMDVTVALHDHEEERNLTEISQIIFSSRITDKAKDMTLSIFKEIAMAEAAVHGKDINEVHFHEIGAVDSIVDIAGVAICLDMLGISKIVCSPLHEGKGFVECRHGVLPIPVPAVAQMLKGSGITLITEDIEAELVTPTGIGIIKALAEGSSPMPQMTIEKVGYGFGKRDTGRLNALRIFMGSLTEKGEAIIRIDAEPTPKREIGLESMSSATPGTIAVLEANIDDMTGEMLGYAMERLFEAGALDVFFTPIQMKKNRPATKLTVLSALSEKNKIVDALIRETSTFGIRIHEAERVVMNRKTETLETKFGPIKIKKGDLGEIEKSAPEYEDCARLAREHNVPIVQIFELAKNK